MKRIIKNNYKIMLGFMVGILLSVTSVYAIDAYIESNKVTYKNNNKNNVQEAIDELYEKSGIHQEKWIDPILNGADPVLKSPLIPVEIKPNGEVYYANLNSEWYNYSEKRWANAIILIDNPSNENYQVGDHIIEDDIESYFVWIPRYKYKIWDMGTYSGVIDGNTITNSNKNLYKIYGSSRIIDIVFGNTEAISKMDESEATLNNYYTHPAFTLGEKNLNGIWVGKFETGYKGAKDTVSAQVDVEESTSVIIKPDVYSWRNITVKNMFMNAYNYKRDLDSHMMKNTEWGAVAYLSHSVYGIGTETRINNNSDYKTGYATAINIDQNVSPGIIGKTSESDKTSPWITPAGYLASTTGNISGVYDMSGGAHENVAALFSGSNFSSNGFSNEEITNYVKNGYIDEYAAGCNQTSYNLRKLGDATGELGPFYNYVDGDGRTRYHKAWYGDGSDFINSAGFWFSRGGQWSYGLVAGQFTFFAGNGTPAPSTSNRIALNVN